MEIALCPESHDEMSPYPSFYCTVQFTVYISLEECLEWRSYDRLDSRDISHPLSRGVYGGEERSYARLDSGDVSHPIPHYIFV